MLVLKTEFFSFSQLSLDKPSFAFKKNNWLSFPFLSVIAPLNLCDLSFSEDYQKPEIMAKGTL